MNKIEEKVLQKYRNEISKIVRNKYRRKAQQEANRQKFQLLSEHNMRKPIAVFAEDIYKTYLPIIEEEIKTKVELFLTSEDFKKMVEAEIKVKKKKLSYKALKGFQQFEINIGTAFLNALTEEVNNDGGSPISKEEIKYILLSILYRIIFYLKSGYKIKIATILSIWCDKRDIRINLPEVKERILEDRLVPKIKLGRTFDYNLFQEINKDNEAIMNYYKAKLERYLSLIKRK